MSDWPPKIPARLARRLAPFTCYRDGWCISHRGRMVHICGKRTPLDEVDGIWQTRKASIEANRVKPARGGRATFQEVVSAFDLWLTHRVETHAMAQRTAEDYRIDLLGFGKAVGIQSPISAIGPAEFSAFAQTLSGRAPSTLTRKYANVRAFFKWAVDEEHLSAMPPFGRYFARPRQQARRDVRIERDKSYSPDELRRLWTVAGHTGRAWIALGLNGALDNSDLANLPMPEPGGVVDLDAGLIDYQRRKKGKVRRVIPLRRETVRLIRHYLKRHRPAGDGPLFLTATGLPLIHFVPSPSRPGVSVPVDAISREWQRIVVRAGLKRPKGQSDGRGFRSLRTSFPNLAPAGFRDEIECIMGHLTKSVLVENYPRKVRDGTAHSTGQRGLGRRFHFFTTSIFKSTASSIATRVVTRTFVVPLNTS